MYETQIDTAALGKTITDSLWDKAAQLSGEKIIELYDIDGEELNADSGLDF